MVTDPQVVPPPGTERLADAYHRVHARLWRALLAWSGDRDVADDAAAEAFAQAARRLDVIENVDAWVWRSAFRIAAGDLHRRARRDLPVGAAAEVDEGGARAGTGTGARAGDGDLPEAVLDLMAALQHLPEQQRACVLLRDIAGLSAHETAQALETSAGTVRVQALRGRRRLRTLLETTDG